jgi:HlyD family secretion protein
MSRALSSDLDDGCMGGSVNLIKVVLPLLAAAGIGFGAATTWILEPEDHLVEARNAPRASTFEGAFVAGLGEVQGLGEPVAIGTPVDGLIARVHVEPGARVVRGDPLFSLDDRLLRSRHELQRRAFATARARLERLRAGTRDELLVASRARVASARAAVDRSVEQFERARSLHSKGALSLERMRSREYDQRAAEAELERAEADLARLRRGAWEHDLRIAACEHDEARAKLELVEVELDRLVVRAPADGLVLAVGVRAGEFVTAGTSRDSADAPVTLARSGSLQVRVQVDEEDASRIAPGARAEAYVRGRVRQRVELGFVRIEPRVVPKRSLSGATTERVDTRVLHVVYEVVGVLDRVYLGQKLDVFIEAND